MGSSSYANQQVQTGCDASPDVADVDWIAEFDFSVLVVAVVDDEGAVTVLSLICLALAVMADAEADVRVAESGKHL